MDVLLLCMVHLVFYLMHPYGFLIHSLLKFSHYSYFIKGYIHSQADSQEAYFKIKVTIKFFNQCMDFKLCLIIVYQLFLEESAVGLFYNYLDQHSLAFLLFHYLGGLLNLQFVFPCSRNSSQQSRVPTTEVYIQHTREVDQQLIITFSPPTSATLQYSISTSITLELSSCHSRQWTKGRGLYLA